MNLRFVHQWPAVLGMTCAFVACDSGQMPPSVRASQPQAAQSKAATSFTVSQVGSGFRSPEGLAVDGEGNVYVADSLNDAVKKVAPPFEGPLHGKITTLGHGFKAPAGVAVDQSGNLYVADTGNDAVKVMTPGGTIAFLGAGFAHPKGVAVDAGGNVYVADYRNGRIVEVAPPFAGATRGTITQLASIKSATAIAVDPAGNGYAASAIPEHAGQGMEHNVFELPAPTGCTPGVTCLRTVLAIAGFSNPAGVAADPHCALPCPFYVADSGRGFVVELSAATGEKMRRIGGRFERPYGIAIDKSGDLFVSDSVTNKVWVLREAGP